MNILHSVHPDDFKTYNTAQIRERFALDDLTRNDEIRFVYTHYDRMIAGVAKPVSKELILQTYDNLRSEFFLERRELGIINVGEGVATVAADGQLFELGKLDCVYLGKGVKDVKFSSRSSDKPAVLFMLSAPAHKTYPSEMVKNSEAFNAVLGSSDTANHRTLYRYIHKEGIQSCQLVMGLTILHSGSVWNTMPPHTHDRRMEVYFYFDVDDNQRVFHYMGQPDETRHILMANHQAVVSPPWSIHAGSGTSNYGFIWGMAGENMEFTDMDQVDIKDIR